MQCNLQLVVHVAKKYENRRRKSLEIMDLIQCWDEIAAKLGISRARTQQLERMALFRLKMMLNKGKELHGTPLGNYNH
jgi:DNA-directed RNA polymerase sigma subunit (sigma70/sigma32)